MVLVTGVTGSGKSSTMAAMVNYINTHENRHILTLENPIEFLHRDIQSSITQREIGSDTTDFKMGLRAALRQDPDVDHDRRDARRRDDRHGDQGGGDGPPAHLHAAHAGRAEHDHAHHGDVPARGAGSRAHPPERVAARGGVAAPAAARRRQGARGGGGDPDRHAGGARHDCSTASASARSATTSPRAATSTACRRSTSIWPTCVHERAR